VGLRVRLLGVERGDNGGVYVVVQEEDQGLGAPNQGGGRAFGVVRACILHLSILDMIYINI
jgi:hypothetical protein